MESLLVAVCGILPLLDADGTQHSSIIPDVTSRVFFFPLSFIFFFTHIRSSLIPSWMAPARCTTVHTGHFILLLLYVSVHLLYFFFSLSLHLFVCSFLSFMFVCDVRRYIQQLREAIYTAHMEDDSFCRTLLSLFWFSTSQMKFQQQQPHYPYMYYTPIEQISDAALPPSPPSDV